MDINSVVSDLYLEFKGALFLIIPFILVMASFAFFPKLFSWICKQIPDTPAKPTRRYNYRRSRCDDDWATEADDNFAVGYATHQLMDMFKL